MPPFKASIGMIIFSFLYEAVVWMFVGEFDLVSALNDAYWFCLAMALVHFGVVTQKQERKRDGNV